MKPPAKLALVLGAGASRGFTHIGALKILEANRVPIHLIVGTSAGSFVGSLSAYGFTAFQIQSLSFSIEKGDIIDLTVPDKGFIKGEKLESYVNHLVCSTPIEKMRTPLYVVATDIQSGEEVVFASGNTGTAVRASCSIPGIFQPVKIGAKTYVDGGLVSPVAVDYARKMGADLVIAVDISTGANNAPPQPTMETILQSVVIMDAARFALSDGDRFRLSSTSGEMTTHVKIMERVPQGTAWFPYHFGQAALQLFECAVDPITHVPSFRTATVSMMKVA